eukprot:TRINITY_DN27493_c0_g1_i1.p1 TRINITY_DN27493_c0_g1~~TRINITY_DN27493_c0_g1_i1.p1  ORF type:complete len:514 (+),score=91.41 TRINITY_DN27493_c0_g1_i1:39-1580(+)
MARLVAALWLLVGAASTPLTLHKTMSSHMVLQADSPAIFGWAAAGEVVTVTLAKKAHAATAQEDGSWLVALPAQQASFKPVDITVAGSTSHIELTDVLFGDVWLCGGQSNMEFSTAEMFDSAQVIAQSEVAGLRLFAVQKNTSSQLPRPGDLADVQYPGGWVRASPSTVCGAEYGDREAYCSPHCGPSAAVKSFARPTWGYFSAVCFVYGRNLVRTTGRPQGLLQSCWGGTSVESWSSKAALARCSSPAKSDGDHYAAMIAPLLKFAIKGAIWYQGEANAGSVASGNAYACKLSAMIQDWRSSWRTNSPLAFIIHSLSAYSGSSGVPAVRWSQYGVANALGLAQVAVTVGTDLSDPGSPCGNVHIRNKTAVGERLSLAARGMVYKQSLAYTGPVVSSFEIVPAGIRITFTEGSLVGGWVEFRSVNQTTAPDWQSIEVTEDLEHKSGWKKATAVVSHREVLVQTELKASAVRYSWASLPTGQLLYDSHGLPAAPFIATCSKVNCTLVPPGQSPT